MWKPVGAGYTAGWNGTEHTGTERDSRTSEEQCVLSNGNCERTSKLHIEERERKRMGETGKGKSCPYKQVWAGLYTARAAMT